MKLLRKVLIAVFATSTTFSACAADSPTVGYVMTVSGEGSVTTNGKIVVAKVGTPVFEGTTLKVNADSSMGVTLNDNTIMSLGPNSEMLIEEYLYAPAKSELKLTTKIAHGTLNFISGVIAKLRPEAVKINTPTGTVGVRGTHLLVKVDP